MKEIFNYYLTPEEKEVLILKKGVTETDRTCRILKQFSINNHIKRNVKKKNDKLKKKEKKLLNDKFLEGLK